MGTVFCERNLIYSQLSCKNFFDYPHPNPPPATDVNSLLQVCDVHVMLHIELFKSGILKDYGMTLDKYIHSIYQNFYNLE